MDAVRQSTRGPVRWQRQLTERQRRKRLEAMLDEIRALGAAYQLTAGQLRWRLLRLEQHLEDTLDRWPVPDRQIPQNSSVRKLARKRSETGRRGMQLGAE
jgi:hypothetical protein